MPLLRGRGVVHGADFADRGSEDVIGAVDVGLVAQVAIPVEQIRGAHLNTSQRLNPVPWPLGHDSDHQVHVFANAIQLVSGLR